MRSRNVWTSLPHWSWNLISFNVKSQECWIILTVTLSQLLTPSFLETQLKRATVVQAETFMSTLPTELWLTPGNMPTGTGGTELFLLESTWKAFMKPSMTLHKAFIDASSTIHKQTSCYMEGGKRGYCHIWIICSIECMDHEMDHVQSEDITSSVFHAWRHSIVPWTSCLDNNS